ncbi:Undecaprenyl-phosphate alpha-N-acetylglucosaminyl 1-phosphate transferase [Sinobacterium norvegicum]|uniref:Undecaprenyl-phosphate alpha-N-acetylglucosaminyl 1-phosphate transferase n=1 Tax=Sinobacterium norvegicum TaxID=1641715 RepID=A0ABM9AJ98_9GAMM|nr:MraY family glycosyltransferase [Sinobacterium norvegicum]CAH0993318.1 Undecaprenyl-phosphate alpha-N-acetylglucosaminyl 1-phosphate transferase [Sinobacterium norvegicum]
MDLVLSFALSLFGTIVLMPPMIRYAANFGLTDEPGDERKIHTAVIPRCGGLAIALASVLPLYLWLPLNDELLGLIIASSIIVTFGVVDDVKELDYKWKFIGQILAVICLIFFGIEISILPFFSPTTTYYQPLCLLVSFFFLLGCINAVNLSDGLDGLAAGVSLLSLGLVIVYASIAEDFGAAMVAIIVIGGLLGFLRFNTYPARVFLGDTGSQLTGLVLCSLALIVTQVDNSPLSPMLPVLMLGLPIFDTLMVMVIRLRAGRSPFSPDKNHLHHRLMGLGFHHYQAVAAIYIMQFSLLASSYFLRYESDLIIAVFYLFFCSILLLMLYLLSSNVYISKGADVGLSERINNDKRNSLIRRFEWFYLHSTSVIQCLLLIFYTFVFVFSYGDISAELAEYMIVVSVVLFLVHLLSTGQNPVVLRLIFYSGGVVATLLLSVIDSTALVVFFDSFLLLLVVVLALAIRMTRKEFFRLDNQDLLVFLAVIVIPQFPFDSIDSTTLGHFTLRIVVLFYASEFLVARVDFNKRFLPYFVPLGLFFLATFSYVY